MSKPKKKTIAELFAEIENTPIAIAVSPLRKLAKQEAKERALATIERVREELAAAGNDLNVCAPYPKGNMPQYEYMGKLNRYYLFQNLTTWRKCAYTYHEPHYADMDKKKCDYYIKRAVEQAEEKYKQYVYKLTHKIGDTSAATLDTFSKDTLWHESILRVTLRNGKTQAWKTKMIWNVSCLGKDFPQFPTRLFEGVKTKEQTKGLR
jgi:hypothetical protein